MGQRHLAHASLQLCAGMYLDRCWDTECSEGCCHLSHSWDRDHLYMVVNSAPCVQAYVQIVAGILYVLRGVVIHRLITE